MQSVQPAAGWMQVPQRYRRSRGRNPSLWYLGDPIGIFTGRYPMQSLEQLESARRRHPHMFDPGSAAERDALERFSGFFSSFAPDRIERLLATTYAPDIYFNDTLKAINGVEALQHYLGESAAAVEACKVEIEDTTRTAAGEYLLRWRMMIRFKRFKRGVDTWSIGISHLRFSQDGLVVYHQDYWNAADGLYEHIPLLGALIRAIKRRL